MKGFCQNCNKQFKIRKFCSTQCYMIWIKKDPSHHPNYDKNAKNLKIKKECRWCKKNYHGPKLSKFCSIKCFHQSRHLSCTIEKECPTCHKNFRYKKSSPKKYCSRKCRPYRLSHKLSKKFQGRDLLREVIRQRDNRTCLLCGKKWKEGQRRFDIHHLNGQCGKRSQLYDDVSNSKNMITLCHKCHLNLPEVKEKMKKA